MSDYFTNWDDIYGGVGCCCSNGQPCCQTFFSSTEVNSLAEVATAMGMGKSKPKYTALLVKWQQVDQYKDCCCCCIG